MKERHEVFLLVRVTALRFDTSFAAGEDAEEPLGVAPAPRRRVRGGWGRLVVLLGRYALTELARHLARLDPPDHERLAKIADGLLECPATVARSVGDVVEGVDPFDRLPEGPALREGVLTEPVEA